MRCKILRTQKLMWRNIMRSIKSQKVSVLHYSININGNVFYLTRGIHVGLVLVLLATYLCHVNNKYTLLIIPK